jgi:hypothetical protein
MDAPLTSPDDQVASMKFKQDVSHAVQDPVKRSYDEAFDGDHPHKNET